MSDNMSPAGHTAVALFIVVCGIVLALLAASLWDEDMPGLLRLAIVALPVIAVSTGIYAYRHRGDG